MSAGRRVATALLALAAMRQSAFSDEKTAPDQFQRGVCYAHAWGLLGHEGYGSKTSQRSMERLKGLGVQWISLMPFGFMPSASSPEIRFKEQFSGGETDERILDETAHAHALGLKVALKPHLWIRHGEWQGELQWPDDAAYKRFMISYRDFVVHHASLAARAGADLFVLGTELKTATLRDPALWRALIAVVRAIYKGPIAYAANWDEAEQVQFWDALDFIGIDAYAPVATHSGATLEELRAGWRTVADGMAALSRKWSRKVLLTEMGYRARKDAGMNPATWVEQERDEPPVDAECQARCYRAAFDVLWGQPWLAGTYVWKWFTDSRNESGPTDYPPSGKPAEAVMSGYYRTPFVAPPARAR